MKRIAFIFALELWCIVAPAQIYFAATDTDTNGNESSFSNEAVWLNPTGTCHLAWTPPPYPVKCYNIYYGTNSGLYQTEVVGLNSMRAKALISFTPKTNVITVTLPLMFSTNLIDWCAIATNTVCVTNPVGNGFYKAGQITIENDTR